MKFVLLINLKLLTIANSFLMKIAEHENFNTNKYENANYCWHFHIYKQRKFHTRKKVYNLGNRGRVNKLRRTEQTLQTKEKLINRLLLPRRGVHNHSNAREDPPNNTALDKTGPRQRTVTKPNKAQTKNNTRTTRLRTVNLKDYSGS